MPATRTRSASSLGERRITPTGDLPDSESRSSVQGISQRLAARCRFHLVMGLRRDESGFTLIELLAVVLVVGVMAAIALPTFLGQSSGNGAPSKSLLRTAKVTAESLALENGYAAINKKLLQTNEPAIATAKGDGPWISAAKGTNFGYTLTATSAITGNKFTITRNADGTVTRTCTIPTKTSPAGGCTVAKGKSGTW